MNALPEGIFREIDRVFNLQQSHRAVLQESGTKERIQKLRELKEVILSHSHKIQEAVFQDFRKPAAEVGLTEIFLVTTEIRHAIRHLKDWMKPKPVKPTLTWMGTKSWYTYEPKGVSLIISPWNYPFQLAIGPLVSAIAAGNCAILKPSELSERTSNVIRELISKTFDEKEVAVFEGDSRVAQALLQKPFDHVFFSGSPRVGKIVMETVARHLSSVTLELGGKSPVLIDSSADLREAARKTIWGKFLNAGQTCVAPDYVLIPEALLEDFIPLAIQYVQKFYGRTAEEIAKNPDFPRIINESHFLRLQELFDSAVRNGARVDFGGRFERSEWYISPTLMSRISMECDLMKEEIFGPILPIVTYTSLDEALEMIRMLPEPLGLYYFGRNKSTFRTVFNSTRTGNVCINEVVGQFSHCNFPFGGIKNSGVGNAHGFYGFRAFSYERPVLKSPKYTLVNLFYPPYTGMVKSLIRFAIKYF